MVCESENKLAKTLRTDAIVHNNYIAYIFGADYSCISLSKRFLWSAAIGEDLKSVPSKLRKAITEMYIK